MANRPQCGRPTVKNEKEFITEAKYLSVIESVSRRRINRTARRRVRTSSLPTENDVSFLLLHIYIHTDTHTDIHTYTHIQTHTNISCLRGRARVQIRSDSLEIAGPTNLRISRRERKIRSEFGVPQKPIQPANQPVSRVERPAVTPARICPVVNM